MGGKTKQHLLHLSDGTVLRLQSHREDSREGLFITLLFIRSLINLITQRCACCLTEPPSTPHPPPTPPEPPPPSLLPHSETHSQSWNSLRNTVVSYHYGKQHLPCFFVLFIIITYSYYVPLASC